MHRRMAYRDYMPCSALRLHRLLRWQINSFVCAPSSSTVHHHFFFFYPMINSNQLCCKTCDNNSGFCQTYQIFQPQHKHTVLIIVVVLSFPVKHKGTGRLTFIMVSKSSCEGRILGGKSFPAFAEAKERPHPTVTIVASTTFSPNTVCKSNQGQLPKG